MTTHLCLLGDANSVHLRRWAGEMQSRGFRVSVVTARPQPLKGVEQRVLSPVACSRDWLWRVREAQRHVRELAPDIVHAHYITSYGYLAARCRRRPLVMTAWGSDILVTPASSRPLGWLTRWTLRQADVITGDSLDLLDRISEFAPRGPVHQVHWGADMARFHPPDGGPRPGFHIASLRSWEPNYNIDVIVQATARLRQARPEAGVHLHLLGGGPDEAKLRAQVMSLGLAPHVSFHGRVDEPTLLEVLQVCQVSVSVPTSDATSVSVLESMACGLPVVASDLPANRQWLAVDDGLLVPPRDAAALAEALVSLCQDGARAARIGAANHQRMRQHGSRSVQMDRMAALYGQLLAGRPVAMEAALP